MPGLSERSDEELMALLGREDLTALEALYDRYHRLTLALAYRVLGDHGAAEDVVQETFLAAWRRASSYNPERGRVREWLLSVARHRAIDRLRGASNPGVTAELDETLADDRSPEVWEQVDHNLRRDRIRQVLGTLPLEQREVIELAYYGGLTHQEISKRTGAPLGTVKGRLRLVMEKLRHTLADLAPGAGGAT